MVKKMRERVVSAKNNVDNVSQRFGAIKALINEMCEEILEWRKVSDSNDPESLKRKLDSYEYELQLWRTLIGGKKNLPKTQKFVKSYQNSKDMADFNENNLFILYNEFFNDRTAIFDSEKEFYYIFEQITNGILHGEDVKEFDMYNIINFIVYLKDNDVQNKNFDINKIYEAIQNVYQI